MIGIWDVSADDGKSNVTASLYKDGKLIISGNGDMNSYDKSSNQPYYNLKEFIKTIEIEDGELTEVDCCYGTCVHAPNCTIAEEIRKALKEK